MYPEQGEILFDGQDICRLSNRELYEVRKRMGMLSNQALYLRIFPRLITWHSDSRHTHLPESPIRQIVLMKLEAVGLRGCGRFNAFGVSGGMARRAH